jgi:hypothetical protein
VAQSPPTTTLTPQQRAEFVERGVIKLAGLIPAESVRRGREAVLAPLARLGLWESGAWRLDVLPRPQWPASGLKVGRKIGHNHPELAALIETADLIAAVDELLEGRPFDRPPSRSRIADSALYPQVLFTLPNIDVWRLPQGWHTDSPRLASGTSPGVQAFAFLDRVDPCGGGTLVVAGSHRFVNEGRTLRLDEIGRRLKRERFFRELMAGRGWEGGALPKARVGEVLVEVVELTGRPGDVWLTDLRLLHCASPNASERPRMMATYRFTRADVVSEIDAAYGRTRRARTEPEA